MKHSQMVIEINKRFEKITAAHERVLFDLGNGDRVIRESVEPEDIHCYRVEVKKLRAFLHLAVPNRKPVLPWRFRDYYRVLGVVRNFQLQGHRIRDFAGDKAQRFIAYSVFLEAGLTSAIQEVRQGAAELFLPHVESRVLEALPEKLGSDSIREYLWKAATKIRTLTQADALLANGELHELRKCLKDLSYNHAFIHEDTANIMPPALAAGRENIAPLLKILGRFQDYRTGLELLQPAGDSHEQQRLATVRRQWEKEKESVRHQFRVTYLPIFQRLFASI